MQTFPMPGDRWDGGTVIASGWLTDDPGDIRIAVMTLRSEPPYYRTASYDMLDGGQRLADTNEHYNIYPATAWFEDNYGLYG